MTQNKVLELFISLALVPELESTLFKMKLDTKGYSGLLILNSTIVFWIFFPKHLSGANLVPKIQSAFFKMNLGIGVFKATDPEFKNSFFKYRPYNTFFGLGLKTSKSFI